jgi:hypothetical protein
MCRYQITIQVSLQRSLTHLHAYTKPRIPVDIHNRAGPRGVPKVERLYMDNRLISSPEQHMGQLPTCKPADSLQQKEKKEALLTNFDNRFPSRWISSGRIEPRQKNICKDD